MAITKKVSPRIPEGEEITDQKDLSMEELSDFFKKRMKEYQNFVDFFTEELQIKNNSKILEIGPGPGWITILLAKKNPTFHIIGLEISEDMIRVANENKKNQGFDEKISYIHGDANNMIGLEDDSFDAVLTHDSLHHWEDPIKVLNEIHRVLKKDGRFCISDGRRDLGFGAKVIFNIIKHFIPKVMAYYWNTSIKAGYTPQEVADIIEHTPFQGKYVVKAGLFDLIIYNKVNE